MVTLIASAVPAAASAFPLDPELGWGNTKHIDYNLIQYAFERQPCMRSEEAFYGCVELVNAMGSFSQPPVALAPTRRGAARAYGALALAEVDEADNVPSGPARAEELARRSRDLRQAVGVAYREQRERIKLRTSTPELQFDTLAKELLERRVAVSAPFAIGYAVNAMVSAQDPHAGFSVKAYRRALAADADGAIVGIGVHVRDVPNDTRLQIARVIEDSPADRAGLRALDVLLRVGDQSVIGLKGSQVATLLRDSKDKPLSLMIEREGVSLPPIFVTPRQLEIENLQVRLLGEPGNHVLQLRIETFWDEQICEKVRAAMTESVATTPKLREEARTRRMRLEDVAPEIKGVVLDLRDNPGGLLDKAVCVAGLFVGPRRILYERQVVNGSVEGKRKSYESGETRVTDRPVVVLVNDTTASAAEVVAASLQDYASTDPLLQRIYVMGTRTHGKGSVQINTPSYEFPELIKTETSAHYFPPLDHVIQLVGVQPDFEIFRAPTPTLEDRYPIRESDLFPPGNGRAAPPPWLPPAERRANLRALESTCLRGQAEHAWSQIGRRADFQLLKAQELLTCQDPSL